MLVTGTGVLTNVQHKYLEIGTIQQKHAILDLLNTFGFASDGNTIDFVRLIPFCSTKQNAGMFLVPSTMDIFHKQTVANILGFLH